MKTIAFVGALVALSVGFSACERSSSIAEPAPDKSDELAIGVVLPLTGHLAATGQLMQQGFDLALDEINADPLGRPKLQFLVEDDSSTVSGAVSAFNRLIHQEGVSVILGPVSSSATQAAFPISGSSHQPDLRGAWSKRAWRFRLPDPANDRGGDPQRHQGHAGDPRLSTSGDDI